MPISNKYNCIFVHIPKTAGTSIESVFGMHGDRLNVGIKPYLNQKSDYDNLFGNNLQHLTAFEIKSKIQNYSDFYKFSFVRNPWDKFVSVTLWEGPKTKVNKNMSKDQFKKKALNKMKFAKLHYMPQVDYIFHSGSLLVDFVGKFENLEEDFQKVCDSLNVNFKLEYRMKVDHKPYQEYYNQEMIDFVSDFYSKDIEYFGYDF